VLEPINITTLARAASVVRRLFLRTVSAHAATGPTLIFTGLKP
jgi:hypothetical protein